MAETKAKQSKDRVDEIIATGKHKGVLTHDELNQTLTDEEMEPSQLENILNELEKRTIKVVKTLPDDLEPDAKELAEEEVITEQELASDYIPDTVNIDDPVKMYLKEIGRVPLLSATEEIEIAKRMGEGDEARQAAAGRGQPAPGGLHCQAVCGPRHAVFGPDPGGQPGADQGGGKIRLHQGVISFPPMPPGGSARPSPAPLRTRPAPSASRCIWWKPSTS